MKNLFYTSPKYLQNLKGIKSNASEIDAVATGSLKKTFVFNDSLYQGEQTIVLLGDSLTAKNGSTSGSTANLYTYSSGFFSWANAIIGQKFKVLKNAGIGGQTSTQILRRVDADVIALNPKFCMFLCGMNDGVTGVDTATLKTNIIAIYEKLNTAGIYSFILTNTTTLNYVEKNVQALLINKWMYEYFIDKPNIKIIDINSALINNSSLTGLINTNVVSDNLHQNNNGGLAGGIEIAKYLNNYAVKTIFPVSALDNSYLMPTSKYLNIDPLQLKDLNIDYSGYPELYNADNVTLDTGVNYWENLGNGVFKLNQTTTSNTPFLDTHISLVVGKYYRIECEYNILSGYDIVSDAIGAPLVNGVFFFKSYSTALTFKRNATPSVATLKIISIREISIENHLASYSFENKNMDISISSMDREDTIGKYKQINLLSIGDNSKIKMGFYPYTLPVPDSYVSAYCEVFIKKASDLKNISLGLYINNKKISSCFEVLSDVDIASLDIPKNGLKLILKTPSYLNPTSTTIKQARASLEVSLFNGGSIDMRLGRAVIS